MKKILLSVFMALIVFAVSADTPTYGAVDGVYEIETDTVIYYASDFCTLTAADDSATLVTKWAPEEGWEYFLEISTLTGTSADSADLKFVADVYCVVCSTDAYCGDSLFYRVPFDTIVDSPGGEALKLPHGADAFGDKYTIKVIAQNEGTELQLILNQLRIVRRRAITLNRNQGR